MPLLRSKSRKKEAEISLEAPKDGCTPIAKAMVLPRSPDETLVVDIAGGLNGGDVEGGLYSEPAIWALP